MMRGFFPIKGLLIAAALILFIPLHVPAFAASNEDLQTLDMYYEANDLVVSATRNPQPLSRTAENITVVTAKEIEMMGAHTLSDVLNNVSGIQTDDRGSVGTFTGVDIQGSGFNHILFLLDGVRLNDFASSIPDVVAIPVQNIERIEIIKGPGSSSWGSALGGVVNIVTKSPNEEKKIGGTLSASIGERLTRDIRGEATGTINRFGYYLFGEHLASNGFQPYTGIEENNLYGKLKWDFPNGGNFLVTVNYNRDSRQDGQANAYDINMDEKFHNFLATASLNYPLREHADLDLSFRTTSRITESIVHILSTGELYQDNNYHEYTYGGTAKITWHESFNSLAAGIDYDHIDNDSPSNFGFQNIFSRINLHSDKWGIFLDDTFSYKTFSISPGIRYDQMHPVGDFISPSLGITWNPTDKLTLRSYLAHGYSLPLILPGQPQEKVFTVQAGIETTYIPWLWLKSTFFRNQLSDVQAYDNTGAQVLRNELKQGVEVEGKTVPIYNTSLSAGYTLVDATDSDTGRTLRNVPSQILKLGVHYDDRNGFRGALLGRYVWWNSSPDVIAKDKAIIWDLTLAKKVIKIHDTDMELFFNIHNLFNGAQYPDDTFKNARRWVEGGIRFNF